MILSEGPKPPDDAGCLYVQRGLIRISHEEIGLS